MYDEHAVLFDVGAPPGIVYLLGGILNAYFKAEGISPLGINTIVVELYCC